MKLTTKQLMDHLGIDRVLTSYQTEMQQVFSPERGGRTCSAEARMGPDQSELDCDIQIFRDAPFDDKPTFEQIMLMKIKPKPDGKWEAISLAIKGDDMTGAYPDWEEDAYKFYAALTLALKRDQIPNIDELINEHLDGEGGRAGRAGRRGKKGGGKRNIKPPGQNLNMKQGM